MSKTSIKAGEGFVGSFLSALALDSEEVAASIAGSSARSTAQLGKDLVNASEQFANATDEMVKQKIQGQIDSISTKLVKKQAESRALGMSEGKWNYLKEQNPTLLQTAGLYARGAAAYAVPTDVEGNLIGGKFAARMGTYAGVNLAGRLISGGTPIHNADGERDIMGIPFI